MVWLQFVSVWVTTTYVFNIFNLNYYRNAVSNLTVLQHVSVSFFSFLRENVIIIISNIIIFAIGNCFRQGRLFSRGAGARRNKSRQYISTTSLYIMITRIHSQNIWETFQFQKKKNKKQQQKKTTHNPVRIILLCIIIIITNRQKIRNIWNLKYLCCNIVATKLRQCCEAQHKSIQMKILFLK